MFTVVPVITYITLLFFFSEFWFRGATCSESCGCIEVAASGQAEITFSSEPPLLAVDDLLSFGDQASSAGYSVCVCV